MSHDVHMTKQTDRCYAVHSFEQTDIDSAATANLTTITANIYINIHKYSVAKPVHRFYVVNRAATKCIN